IIAMASVTGRGQSKIVPFLQQGAGVVTTRAHVHYVVTEYGVAYLYGKNLRQRAQALIAIAHPDHRESLDRAMHERFPNLYHPVCWFCGPQADIPGINYFRPPTIVLCN